MPKITDYTAKTAFNDGDLYDCSTYDGVSAYATEKVTWLQLKNELSTALSFNTIYSADDSLTSARTVTLSPTNTLTFTGGLTTFVGQDATSSNKSISAKNSTDSRELYFSNSGVFRTGYLDGTSYFQHNIQIAKIYSSVAAVASFVADRGGTKLILQSKSKNAVVAHPTIKSTSHLSFAVNGVSEGDVDGTRLVSLRDDNELWFGYGANGSTQMSDFASNQRVVIGRKQQTTSVATQSDSLPLVFKNSTWVSSSETYRESIIQTIASTTVADLISLDFNVKGTTQVKFWSDGNVSLLNLPTASTGLSAGMLWNDAGTVKIV